MTQIFFIAPNGTAQVQQALTPRISGTGLHAWTDDGDTQAVGVIELTGGCDPEVVLDRLEAAGVMWLPNHQAVDSTLKAEHVAALAKHGVKAGHTTQQAMTLVQAKAGFPPLRTKRF